MRKGDALVRAELDDALAERARRFDACRSPKNADDLHDLRVASRRLRAAIQMAACLGALEDLKPLRRKLRRVGRRLGEIREADVNIERLEAIRTSGGDELGFAAEIALAGERARRERLSIPAARKMKLGGASPLSKAGGSEAVSVISFARQILPPACRGLAVLAADAAATSTAFRLHRARIAAKKLRYSIELLAAGFQPGRAARILSTLRGLQDRLGVVHDGFVLHRRLTEIRRDFRSAGLTRLDVALLPLLKEVHREQAAASALALRRIRELVARDFFSGIEASLRSDAEGR